MSKRPFYLWRGWALIGPGLLILAWVALMVGLYIKEKGGAT